MEVSVSAIYIRIKDLEDQVSEMESTITYLKETKPHSSMKAVALLEKELERVRKEFMRFMNTKYVKVKE